MQTFLMIVGGIVVALFVLIILVLAGAYLWFRWKLRRLLKSHMEMVESFALDTSVTPPFRISLDEVSADNWDHPEGVQKLSDPLRDLGYDEIGTFVIPAIDVRMQAFVHRRDFVYAVVYEHPQAGNWVDFVSRYEDGSGITYANNRDDLMDRPENKPAEFFEGMPTGELHDRFLAERTEKPFAPLRIDDFAAFFERAWAEEMDWRIARGGPVEKEVRRIAERDGQECTSETVNQLRNGWAGAISIFYYEQMRDEYIKGLSAAEWEEIRERVIFIHERLTPDDVVERYSEWLDWEDEDKDKADSQMEAAEEIARKNSPRKAFAELNSTLSLHKCFEKIGEIDVPIAADVYLSPEEEYDDED